MRLSTDRLELIASTPRHVRAELEAPERLGALLGVRVEPGWPPGAYDREVQAYFLNRLAAGGTAVAGWYAWYAVRRGDAYTSPARVGAGGYLGPPDAQGEVEIGFSVMPSWQGFGLATEMARALVRHAFADSRTRKIVAHTAPRNRASRRVLQKCGFRFSGRSKETGNHRFEIGPGRVSGAPGD